MSPHPKTATKDKKSIVPRHRWLRAALWFLVLFAAVPAASQGTNDSVLVGQRVDFVENRGQWPQQVQFRTQTDRATFFLEDSAFTILLRQYMDPPTSLGIIENTHVANHFRHYHYHAYRMRFVGAASATITGDGQSAGYENYYLGSDSSRWASGCRLFGMARYDGIYPGIDMRVFSTRNGVKYEFVVSPGSSPSPIAMAYDSVASLMVKDGTLVVGTSAGDLIEMKPYVYQETASGRVEVASHYVVNGNTVRFALGSYDTTLSLVIDPFLYFSTYTGSTADNWGTTAAYDSYKNVYTAGLVFSNGYPTSLGAFDNSYRGNADIGIFKFDSSGSQRLFATYLGGSMADMPHSMYVNSLDELIIFGTTGSPDFPTSTGAYDRTFNGGSAISYLCPYNNAYYNNIYYPNGSDIFVSRFNSTGSQLQASTYLGGTGNDGLNYRTRYNNQIETVMQGNDSLYYNYGDGARGEVICDNLNNVYIGSTTFSTDLFPTMCNIQTVNRGGQDGLVAKLDYNLSHLLWGTYFGGEHDDAIYSIDVDDHYNLLICGGTNSYHLRTTPESYHPTPLGGPADAFAAKLDCNGTRILASTFFGSNAYDQAYFVRCGRHNEVYLFGQTKAEGSTLIHNAFYNTPNSGQFIARFSPDLDSLVWSTTFGTGNGRPNISPTAFGVDVCNRVYAVGWGRDFVGYNNIVWNTSGTTDMEITTDAFQGTTDGQDFYIMSLSADASQLEYASFFGELHQAGNDGEDHVDGGTSRFDKLGTLYQSVCASCGGYDNFPTTTGVWSPTNPSSRCNNALFRFNINSDFAVAEFVQPPADCAPYDIQFHNTGRGASYSWDFGDGTTSTDQNPSHTYTAPGQYQVTLIATIPGACNVSDTMTRTIHVVGVGHSAPLPTMACYGQQVQIGLSPVIGCSYQWIQGAVSDSSVANPWVGSDGAYVLRITADSGCTELDTFSVRYFRLIDTILVTNPTCPGDCNGQAVAITNPDQAVGSIIYDWNGMLSPDSILSDQCGSSFVQTLTVTDGRCTSSATYSILQPDPMQITKEAYSILCADSCEGWIHIITDHHIDTTLSGLCPGEHALLLNDSLGCPYHDTTLITVNHLLDDFSAWADDSVIFLTQSTMLHATSIPGAQYSWHPAAEVEHPHLANTLATPTDTLATYMVQVTDTNGCQASDTILIRCIEVNCGEGNIFIPNAFTPNDDGINDRLCFRGQFVVDFHIVIYTRWGELIYESNDINESWDGRFKDNWCMPGVYTYSCQITCEAGIKTLLKGNITLIR